MSSFVARSFASFAVAAAVDDASRTADNTDEDFVFVDQPLNHHP